MLTLIQNDGLKVFLNKGHCGFEQARRFISSQIDLILTHQYKMVSGCMQVNRL